MRFRKAIPDEEPRLGIAPLIDVVFLLLIFFMVTSHFNLASGIPIRLPKVAQKSYDREEQKVTLVMDARGNVYLEGEKIDLASLGSRLQVLVEKEGLVQLLLEADKTVQHGNVVQVMDLAKQAGVLSIVIAARWEPHKGY
jgi:biopolymer transport protein ExbD